MRVSATIRLKPSQMIGAKLLASETVTLTKNYTTATTVATLYADGAFTYKKILYISMRAKGYVPVDYMLCADSFVVNAKATHNNPSAQTQIANIATKNDEQYGLIQKIGKVGMWADSVDVDGTVTIKALYDATSSGAGQIKGSYDIEVWSIPFPNDQPFPVVEGGELS